MSDNLENSKVFSPLNIGSGKLLDNLYKDIAQPGLAKVGQALGTVFDLSNTILLPIKLLNERTKLIFQKNISNYQAKLDGVAEDKICEVPPELGIPILDKLTYTTNKELSNAFINLLVSASNIDTLDSVHPGFIKVIEQISPDEARIISFFTIAEVVEFISYKVRSRIDEDYDVPEKYLTGIEFLIDLYSPKSIMLYWENLIKLGIVALADYKMTKPKIFKRLQEIYISLEKEVVKNYVRKDTFPLEIEGGLITITKFGDLFLSACISPEDEDVKQIVEKANSRDIDLFKNC